MELIHLVVFVTDCFKKAYFLLVLLDSTLMQQQSLLMQTGEQNKKKVKNIKASSQIIQYEIQAVEQ